MEPPSPLSPFAWSRRSPREFPSCWGRSITDTRNIFLVGHRQIFDINVPHTVHKDIDTDRRTYYISQNFDIVPLGLSH